MNKYTYTKYLKKSPIFKATRGYGVCFYIYDNLKSMRADIKTTAANIRGLQEVIGYFRCGLQEKTGHIFIYLPKIGSGLIAHELQHFIQFWINQCGYKPIYDRSWELVALKTGKITASFWEWFYENFDFKPGPK